MDLTTDDLRAHPIPPDELDRLRRTGRDTEGRAPVPWPEPTGMPLRCCLRPATEDDDAVLVSYAPLAADTAWREVGPVLVHRRRCAGFRTDRGLPPDLHRGPRVLRGYSEHGELVHDSCRVVDDSRHLGPDLCDLLARPDVTEVHVRAVAAQCFTYRVRVADD